MGGACIELVHRRLLDDVAGIHDGDRSARRATTPRSCEIQITAVPSSACSRFTSSTICAWMVTSSAVVGSSAMISSGEQASAIAIMTRWRMPPENWCG